MQKNKKHSNHVPRYHMQCLLRTTALVGFVVITACSPGGNDQNYASTELTKKTENIEFYESGAIALEEPAVKKTNGLVLQRLGPQAGMPLPSVISGQDAALAPLSEIDRENYNHLADNPVHLAQENPISTFSIDVDTGGYSNVRRFLKDGTLPQENAVRIEELVNYFSYNYPLPEDQTQPFKVFTEVAPTPWNADTKLIHIGIKAFDVPAEDRPAANLIFLVDISGSMHAQNKLPLLKSSLRLMVDKMTEKDRISLVTYAGSTRVVLPATPGNKKAKIRAAIEALSSGGSTNGGAGIKLAYAEAQKEFIEGGINRILLATDGDVNVGTVDFDALKDMVERKRRGGVSLTTLGFGTGNYNDHLLEQLADSGNGNHAYIDSLSEARKVLVEEMSSTLITVAKDVKIQVEFNPAVVAEYRLIGYENRILNREDFNNDKVDAGEIGAGHTVTALYEVALVGSEGSQLDPLRYGKFDNISEAISTKQFSANDELAYVKVRYKAPDGDKSDLLAYPIEVADMKTANEKTDDQFRFSAAVAAFGQILKGGKYTGDMTMEDVHKLARSGLGEDPFGYRREFLNLVDLASSMTFAAK
ncbi:vWA domain-containing protein [Kiloniella antarctica]|uniref:von Willebrand factor type A domain-containing protein n=1 Tax=Kiloniella antarctica TaxID=1550907 RepID=A0ABW5BMM7_9PROT